MPSIIQTILEEYVTRLRLIPELVTALGGDATVIKAHHQVDDEEQDVVDLILRLPEPFLLGYLGNSAIINRASRESFGYEVRFAGRFGRETKWMEAFDAFCNGTPTGSPNKLRYQAVSDRAYPMSAPQFRRVNLPISETTAIVYPEITFTVALRGD